ncbi:hypothetical protein CBS101457_003304 [Exobasidium rhododendri]|nr:hypothetical protein CBS101457_003304 [Exobasidium rhododendri]
MACLLSVSALVRVLSEVSKRSLAAPKLKPTVEGSTIVTPFTENNDVQSGSLVVHRSEYMEHHSSSQSHELRKRSPMFKTRTKVVLDTLFKPAQESAPKPTEETSTSGKPYPSFKNSYFYYADEAHFQKKADYYASRSKRIQTKASEESANRKALQETVEINRRKSDKASHRVRVLQTSSPFPSFNERNSYRNAMTGMKAPGRSLRAQDDYKARLEDLKKKFVFWDVETERKVMNQVELLERETGSLGSSLDTSPSKSQHLYDQKLLREEIKMLLQRADEYERDNDGHRAAVYRVASKYKERKLAALSSASLSEIERDHYAHKSAYASMQRNKAEKDGSEEGTAYWRSKQAENAKRRDFWKAKHASQVETRSAT